jgi:ESCRT-I complex subunit VPS28
MSSAVKDREKLDNLADIYSIIVATEHLERAYLRDALTQQSYILLLNKLISQYHTASENIKVTQVMPESLLEVNFL